jgi:ATP-dependent DNA helicase RecQ
LTGDADIHLSEPKEARLRPERIAVATLASGLSTAQQSLLAALKAKRMDLARRDHVPAYVIFNEKTLIEMAVQRPSTLKAMSEINGIGEHKLARFGAIFLETIHQHRS